MKMTREEFNNRSKERIEKMMEKNEAGDIRAVVANAPETKNIASKLQILDMVFNNVRRNIGYSLDTAKAIELIESCKAIDSSLQALIEKATEYGVYKPREVSELSKYKAQIIELANKGKDVETIAKELSLPEDKINGWLGNLKAEIKTPTKEAKEKKAS